MSRPVQALPRASAIILQHALPRLLGREHCEKFLCEAAASSPLIMKKELGSYKRSHLQLSLHLNCTSTAELRSPKPGDETRMPSPARQLLRQLQQPSPWDSLQCLPGHSPRSHPPVLLLARAT